MKAYILIKVETGDAKRVISELNHLKRLKSSDLVTGPYDAIMVVEAADMNEIAELVVDKVDRIPGITSTMTCLPIKTYN